MKWTNESANNPGFSVYYAHPDRDPKVLYVIRKKQSMNIGWRVFVRPNDGVALRTIYVAETLKEAKQFVQELEDANAQ